jgi:hypothetical protein
MWILWLFFLPILLVFAAFAVLAGLAGLFFGTLHFWPLFLVIFGLWLLLRGPGRRRRHWDWDWDSYRPSPRAAEPVTTAEPSRPRPSATSTRRELPIDLQVKVEQIRRKVDVLLGYADRFPPFSHELYLVRQTAEDYLPRTINAYLAMPAEATDTPLNGHTRTAREELKAQLDLLDAKLDEIATDLQRQDTERLLSNRRFLEDRFGRASAG